MYLGYIYRRAALQPQRVFFKFVSVPQILIQNCLKSLVAADEYTGWPNLFLSELRQILWAYKPWMSAVILISS